AHHQFADLRRASVRSRSSGPLRVITLACCVRGGRASRPPSSAPAMALAGDRVERRAAKQAQQELRLSLYAPALRALHRLRPRRFTARSCPFASCRARLPPWLPPGGAMTVSKESGPINQILS